MDRDERIRLRAYEIWAAEGCPEGRKKEHWQLAVAEIENSSHEASEDAGAVEVGQTVSPAPEEASSAPGMRTRRAA